MNRLWPAVISSVAAAATLFAAAAPAPAATPATCTADLTIITSITGKVTDAGQSTHYRGLRVTGHYASGFLNGYSFVGQQNVQRSNVIAQAQFDGEYVATGPGGSLTVHFTLTGDLRPFVETATGKFNTVAGTGSFAGFHWHGTISARFSGSGVGVALLGTATGSCEGL